jgi:hypothetical protein
LRIVLEESAKYIPANAIDMPTAVTHTCAHAGRGPCGLETGLLCAHSCLDCEGDIACHYLRRPLAHTERAATAPLLIGLRRLGRLVLDVETVDDGSQAWGRSSGHTH